MSAAATRGPAGPSTTLRKLYSGFQTRSSGGQHSHPAGPALPCPPHPAVALDGTDRGSWKQPPPAASPESRKNKASETRRSEYPLPAVRMLAMLAASRRHAEPPQARICFASFRFPAVNKLRFFLFRIGLNVKASPRVPVAHNILFFFKERNTC